MAVETDAALGRTASHVKVAGLSTEADTALALGAPPALSAGLVVAEGDSLTEGSEGPVTPWTTPFASANPLVQVFNVALHDEEIGAHMIGQGASQVDVRYNGAKTFNCWVIWGGTNDMAQSGRTPAQVYADLKTWCAARRSANPTAKICVVNVTHNSFLDDSIKNAYNALLAGDGLVHFDMLVDADSVMGNLATQPSWWQSDDLHLTAAGNVVIANLISNKLRAFFA